MEDTRYENKYHQKNRSMPRLPTGEILTSWVFKNQEQGVERGTTEPITAGSKTVTAEIGLEDLKHGPPDLNLSFPTSCRKIKDIIAVWPLWHPCREACSTAQYVYLLYLPTQIRFLIGGEGVLGNQNSLFPLGPVTLTVGEGVRPLKKPLRFVPWCFQIRKFW